MNSHNRLVLMTDERSKVLLYGQVQTQRLRDQAWLTPVAFLFNSYRGTGLWHSGAGPILNIWYLAWGVEVDGITVSIITKLIRVSIH